MVVIAFVFVVDDDVVVEPRHLALKFGQNKVSNILICCT